MTQPSTPRRAAYDTFRPSTGRWVAGGAALATLVIFTLVAVYSPMPLRSNPEMELMNRISIALIGLGIAFFLSRYAVIRAVPSREGLRVVNLIRSHDLEWAQIMRVGFSGGAPWAVLELSDFDEISIMAIQRADGERARAEASRLAALIEHHSRPSGPTLD
ncbi:PH domain-containing protein [Ornithinimicrobium panacihumi]|uniref:PH domain-containing protein n=1 Tax=Ornithinimicrobium panacihumi TaxID=2008449 RepID=UPI003F8B9474